MKSADSNETKIIGWREWVRLPELGIDAIKAKIDTGARSSSLDAFDLRFYEQSGKKYVEFKVPPNRQKQMTTIECHAEVLEFKNVKSSNGQVELRPVIKTLIELMGRTWAIEITLTSRVDMKFRMLLGRTGFYKGLLIDAGKSYLNGKPAKI